jgi:hypothetical protein
LALNGVVGLPISVQSLISRVLIQELLLSLKPWLNVDPSEWFEDRLFNPGPYKLVYNPLNPLTIVTYIYAKPALT